MNVSELVDICNQKYEEDENKFQCEECENDCKGCCTQCMEDIHFGGERRYNCRNMINCYVCKYIYKYSSEIEILLGKMNDITNLQRYNVLSFGCGPCTDLFGLNNFVRNNDNGKEIEYLGVDLNDKWRPVHNEIDAIIGQTPIRTRFVYNDIFAIIDRIGIREDTWKPTILSLQYVISDMIKYKNTDEMKELINKVIEKIVWYMPNNSYIIVNDINYQTARYYFEYFYEQVLQQFPNSDCYRFHFDNNARANHYHYGTEHDNNDTTTLIPANIRKRYNPWDFCSSSQIIIQKKE